MMFFLASGGTGGHIFPAESLAEELIGRGHKVVFITDERYKNYDGALKKFRVEKIPAATLKGGFISKLKSLLKIFLGIIAGLKILCRQGGIVIGFGGYPSFPTVIAARMLGLKIIIHEQNSVLGRANKILILFADIVATSFPEVRGISAGNRAKIAYTGNPVRKPIAVLAGTPYPKIENMLNILVIGGSLGATVFSDVVPAAIKKLSNETRKKIKITQQARREDIERVQKIYSEIGVDAEIAGFFADIPERFRAAHLVIARSGASTVAELAVAGRPAILVPYPNSNGDHQLYNAKSLEKTGGAWVVEQKDFDSKSLAFRLETFFLNLHLLQAAAENSSQSAKPDAVKKLADLAEKIEK